MHLKRSLRKKIIIISVLFLLAGLLINSAIYTIILVANYSAGLVGRAHVLGNSLKYKLDRLLQFHIPLQNIVGFQSQCMEITATYSDISYAMVTDLQGIILFHSDPSKQNSRFFIPDENSRFDGGVGQNFSAFTHDGNTNVVIPVRDLDQDLAGMVVIGYSQKLVMDRIPEMVRNSAILALILCAVMILFLLVLLTVWVTGPLSSLMDVIENMRGGGISDIQEQPAATNDEIGQLSTAFYRLLNELKTSREKLEKYAGELETKVYERTYELNTVNNNLMAYIAALEKAKEEEKKLQSQLARSQKFEAIGNLASGVAHDLNNILSGLINYPELLLMEMPSDSPYIKPITGIKRSGERAAAMVQDLLTLARRGVALAIPMNINAVINEFCKSPEFNSLERQFAFVTVHLKLGQDLKNIMGTPFHITKILMNLVTNSAEAIIDSGEVVISTQDCFLEAEHRGFETIPPGEYVLLKVADTGVGIASEHVEKMFEPFYTKKVLGRRSGTGLGMAVVFGTVKDHKGYIDVSSEINEGTVVSLYFQPTAEKTKISAVELPIDQYRGDGERILVVDDIQEQREIAESILVKLGYAPSSVASGEEAVEYLKGHEVSLVILDMIMDPGIDGLETYRRICATKPGQKAIVASGFTETARVLAMQELGAGAFVKKPYSMERLGLAIREELKRGNPEASGENVVLQ